MKRFLTVFLALSLCVGLSGCCLFTSANQTFVKGVDGYAQVILPEYEKYLDADPNLKPESKKLRKETAQKFRALIEEEKE